MRNLFGMVLLFFSFKVLTQHGLSAKINTREVHGLLAQSARALDF